MHIAEGLLPVGHAALWTAAAVPFIAAGAARLGRLTSASPATAVRVVASGGFTLLLSSLKLPSVGGSSSHPTGMGLGTLVCGPAVMPAIAAPVLLLQALLFAHGGLTTLGANTIAMGVVGPWSTWLVARTLRACGLHRSATGVGAAVGALATYATTAGQLALAYPDPVSGVAGAMLKFGAIFGVTQVPLAIAEGLFTLAALSSLASRLDSLEAAHGA